MFDVSVTRLSHHVKSIVTAAAVSRDDRHLVFALRDQNTLVFYNNFNPSGTLSYVMQVQAHTAPVMGIDFIYMDDGIGSIYVFSVALDFTILMYGYSPASGTYVRWEHNLTIPVPVGVTGLSTIQDGALPTTNLVGITEPPPDPQGRGPRGFTAGGSGNHQVHQTEQVPVPLTRYIADLFYGDTLVSWDATQQPSIFLGTLSGHIIHLYLYDKRFTVRIVQSLQDPVTALQVLPMVNLHKFYYIAGTTHGSALLRRLNTLEHPDLTALPQPQADASFDRVTDVFAFQLQMLNRQALAVPDEISTPSQLFGSALLSGDLYFVLSCTQGGVLNVYISEDVQPATTTFLDPNLMKFCAIVQDGKLYVPFIRADLGVGPLKFLRVCPHKNLAILAADGSALFVDRAKFLRDGKQFYDHYKDLLFQYVWQTVTGAPTEAAQRQLEALQHRVLTDPTQIVDKVFSGTPGSTCVAASFQTANEPGPSTCGCVLHVVTCSQSEGQEVY